MKIYFIHNVYEIHTNVRYICNGVHVSARSLKSWRSSSRQPAVMSTVHQMLLFNFSKRQHVYRPIESDAS